MRIVEEYRRYYICGVPGNYAIKSYGNNRIVARDLPTLAHARQWLTNKGDFGYNIGIQ